VAFHHSKRKVSSLCQFMLASPCEEHSLKTRLHTGKCFVLSVLCSVKQNGVLTETILWCSSHGKDVAHAGTTRFGIRSHVFKQSSPATNRGPDKDGLWTDKHYSEH